MPITKLSTSINKLFKGKNFKKIIEMGKLQANWKKIVGENIESATKIIDFKNETIYIKCKNPTWKNELNFYKKDILLKIQQKSKKINKIIII